MSVRIKFYTGDVYMEESMSGKTFKWQVLVGALLLVMLIGCIFLPGMKISGKKYISMAVSVNKYAEKKDKKAAEKAKTKEVTDTYKEGSKKTKEKAKEFNKEINKKAGDISLLRLGKWGLTVKKNKLEFPGISFKKGKKIEDSKVQTVFKIMGILIYLPAFFAIFVLVWILIRQKPYGSLLCVTGVVTECCCCAVLFLVPVMVWKKISPYVDSFTLIGKDTLLIKGVGQYAIKKMVLDFSSIGMYANLTVGGILILTGILFMTVLRPKTISVPEEESWDFGITDQELDQQAAALDLQGNINQIATQPAASFAKGVLCGVSGQYEGIEIEFETGEEIILGRDPRYCKLIFDYPKVSRKHCGVQFDAVSNMYRIIDYSSNGTKFADGSAVAAGSYTSVKPGTVIYLANSHEAFRLG